jgi:hypothetical protein
MAEIRSATGPGIRETKIARSTPKTLEAIKKQLDRMMLELSDIKRIVRDIDDNLRR